MQSSDEIADPGPSPQPKFAGRPPGTPWRTVVPFPKYRSEKQLADDVLARLSFAFEVRREVTGTHCSGQRMRLDAVLRPYESSSWKDGEHAMFGVEFKYPPDGAGTNRYTRWLAQAIDYTHVDWDGIDRRLMIFTCPGVFAWLGATTDSDDKESRSPALVIPRMLGQLGVGEIVNYAGYGLTIQLQGGHRLWSEWDGVREGDRWSLKVKSGSR